MSTTRYLGSIGAILVFAGIAAATEYETEVFIPGYGFHGIHGITFDSEDRMYVGSVVGQSIYRVDPKTGESEVWEGPLNGMADDLEFGPDGDLYWTSFIIGKVHARGEGGEIRELATDLPGMNSLAFKQDGRLFATQVFLADALYELDPTGEKPPRKIIEGMGGLNGFDFGPDGYLYGPLWFKGQVARVDVDTGELTVVAEGFTIPAAVNFNSKGELYVVDTGSGEIVRVDVKSGKKTVVSEFKTAMDNLAFDSQDRLFVTVMSESAIFEIDTKTGTARAVKEAKISIPADLEIRGDTLYIAETFCLRKVDLKTGKVESIARIGGSELEYPNGVTTTENRIHTASWFNSVVQSWDRETGELLHTYHEIPTAFDVLELEDGSLIVLQMFPGSISKLSEEQERETLVRGLTTPVAMVDAGDGAVYVTLFAPGEVVRVDLATGEKTVVATGLSGPEGIAVMPDGRIVVVEAGSKSVSAIDPATGAREVLSDGGIPIGVPSPPGTPPMGSTAGVAVAANGDVYVAADMEDAIYRIRRISE